MVERARHLCHANWLKFDICHLRGFNLIPRLYVLPNTARRRACHITFIFHCFYISLFLRTFTNYFTWAWHEHFNYSRLQVHFRYIRPNYDSLVYQTQRRAHYVTCDAMPGPLRAPPRSDNVRGVHFIAFCQRWSAAISENTSGQR